MKMIIDANVASAFMQRTDEAKAIMEWLKRTGTISTGGLNFIELNKTKIRIILLELIRAGKGTICPNELIDLAMATVQKKDLKSDDPHILALALASGARLLFTNDDLLIKDFKNKSIIDSPRGSVYRSASKHGHLLA